MTVRISTALFTAAILGLAAAALAVAAVTRFAPKAPAAVEVMTPGKARAIGAKWRAARTADLERDYAQALVAAGLYDDLLAEISEQGLFSDDPETARLFRAEAALRQGRFLDAFADASGRDDNPYFAFVRARARYNLTATARDAMNDLNLALRGPDDLAGEAWLVRVRFALDENDFETADAALRRAEEAGASADRIEALRIERRIRSGDLGEAAKMYEARAARFQSVLDHEGLRLAALQSLINGDASAATRFADLARDGMKGAERVDLLAALSKWRAGEPAQAAQLTNQRLAAAPKDWVALDLAYEIARDMKRDDAAGEFLRRLGETRPDLAYVRMNRAGASADQLAAAVRRIKEQPLIRGAGATLMGADRRLVSPGEATDREVAIIALAAAIASGDAAAMRRAAEKAAEDGAPLSLAIAGDALSLAGDSAGAAGRWKSAIALAPDFYAPVERFAAALEAAGDFKAATLALRRFTTENPSHVDARFALARLLSTMGEFADAADTYGSIPPTHIFASAELAQEYGAVARKAGPAETEKMIRTAKAVAISPRVLGFALAAAGDKQGAATVLRRAVIADPADSALVSLFEATMTDLGRRDEALSLIGEIERRKARETEGDPAQTQENSPV